MCLYQQCCKTIVWLQWLQWLHLRHPHLRPHHPHRRRLLLSK